MYVFAIAKQLLLFVCLPFHSSHLDCGRVGNRTHVSQIPTQCLNHHILPAESHCRIVYQEGNSPSRVLTLSVLVEHKCLEKYKWTSNNNKWFKSLYNRLKVYISTLLFVVSSSVSKAPLSRTWHRTSSASGCPQSNSLLLFNRWYLTSKTSIPPLTLGVCHSEGNSKGLYSYQAPWRSPLVASHTKLLSASSCSMWLVGQN